MRTKFENPGVYQRSEALTDEVRLIAVNWNSLARDTVGKQLKRAADSIGANIAEGEGGKRNMGNRRFMRISFGSLPETQRWLRRAFKMDLFSADQIELLSQD